MDFDIHRELNIQHFWIFEARFVWICLDVQSSIQFKIQKKIDFLILVPVKLGQDLKTE
jgi:hypothetical protein